jgi:hypothetical protein
MATTTNFGWVTPDNTDLVKDGASAIRTLGSSIDSSMADLKGGTTGQVLSKTTGTDMDFTWVTTDDTNAIQNAIVDAKGDLIGATAADTPARLAVGTNGQMLTADSTAATGLAWATPTTGMTVISSGSLSSAGTSLTSITQTYKDLVLVLRNAYTTTGGSGVRVRVNNDSSGIYASTRIRNSSTAVINSTNDVAFYLDDFTSGPTTSDQGQEAVFSFLDYTNTTTRKLINFSFFYQTAALVDVNCGVFGAYKSNSAVTRIDILPPAGNLVGTYILYGVK